MNQFDFEDLHGEFCSLVLDSLDGKKSEESEFEFRSHIGLCGNFDYFLKNHRKLHIGLLDRDRMNYHLSELFGHSTVPFNQVGQLITENMNHYYNERDRGNLYENPLRLAHLRKYATRKVS